MGGKPDTSAADEANKIAREEAKRARIREAERQARLTTGYGQIRDIFEGTPVYAENVPQTFDWTTFKAPSSGAEAKLMSGIPEGFTVAKKGGGKTVIPRTIGGLPATGNESPWGLLDAAGNWYAPGSTINYVGKKMTGRTGGFDDSFYAGIRQNVTNLGNLDISDQYNRARENLQYALARQGLTTSSVANRATSDVLAAKAKAEGDLALQAKAAEAKVRGNVDAEKNAAISQLYATEDPTLAANTSLAKQATILADKPNYDTLGNIFQTALGGFGNIISAARGSGGGGTYATPYAQAAGG